MAHQMEVLVKKCLIYFAYCQVASLLKILKCRWGIFAEVIKTENGFLNGSLFAFLE